MNRFLRLSPCLLACIVIGLGLLVGRADEASALDLDPNLPYRAKKSNLVTYDVDFTVVVTAPSATRLLKVWLPLPQTDAGQEVDKGEIHTFPIEVKPAITRETVFDNQFAYFELPHPEGAQVIRHRFRIKVWELRWQVDPAQVVNVPKWPASFEPYLRSDQAVMVDERFRRLAQEIVPRPQGAARDLGAILRHVSETMKYDHADASLKASSEHALLKERGHCSDYHGLCAAVGRALGHPTRITYGINTFPKASPSHCKLEAFLPPYGWVSFDVSETQRLIDAIKQTSDLSDKQREELVRAAGDRLMSGFRDNTWFLQTKGTDYDLAPPASRRVPVVRTIYAEADGVPLPEPDPANPNQREFAWMTAHKYTSDRQVTYPFRDWKSLLEKRGD